MKDNIFLIKFVNLGTPVAKNNKAVGTRESQYRESYQ